MNRLQSPKSAIESHLGFAESFRVHEPISTSQFAAVSTPPPRINSLRYTPAILIMGMGRRVGRVTPCAPFAHRRPRTGAHGVTRPTNLTK
jgi:hypothetical protein